MIDETQRRATKVAGFAYLFTFAVVVYANFGIHDKLNVAGNAAATAEKIVAHQQLFRAGIMLDLLYCAGFVALIAALYTILEPASRALVRVAAFWHLVYVVTWLVMTIKLFDVLRLLNAAEYLKVFDVAHLQALAKLELSGRFDRYYGGLLFYSLGSTVFNCLWLKSGYIPRPFAWWGVLSCAWCVLCTVIFLLFPGFSKVVNLWFFDTSMGLYDLALGVWLLVKGLAPARTVPAGVA